MLGALIIKNIIILNIIMHNVRAHWNHQFRMNKVQIWQINLPVCRAIMTIFMSHPQLSLLDHHPEVESLSVVGSFFDETPAQLDVESMVLSTKLATNIPSGDPHSIRRPTFSSIQTFYICRLLRAIEISINVVRKNKLPRSKRRHMLKTL